MAFLIFAGIFLYSNLKGLTLFRDHMLLKYLTVIVTAAVLYETVQFGLPYRAFNPWDMASNLAGAVIGLLIIVISAKTSKDDTDRPVT